VNWKNKDAEEYQTRTEWHRVIAWGKLAEWAGSLKKGAFVEVEGELRYREFQPEGSAQKVRIAEIHANSVLSLDRAEKADPADQDTSL
jgi:single-strand DNA-binding protein